MKCQNKVIIENGKVVKVYKPNTRFAVDNGAVVCNGRIIVTYEEYDFDFKCDKCKQLLKSLDVWEIEKFFQELLDTHAFPALLLTNNK